MKKILCKLPKWLGGGHKRGRREFSDLATGTVTFRCPRCDKPWTRKERKAPKLKAVA